MITCQLVSSMDRPVLGTSTMCYFSSFGSSPSTVCFLCYIFSGTRECDGLFCRPETSLTTACSHLFARSCVARFVASKDAVGGVQCLFSDIDGKPATSYFRPPPWIHLIYSTTWPLISYFTPHGKMLISLLVLISDVCLFYTKSHMKLKTKL